jgi:uncharacterized protein (DUF2062 family)
MFRRRKSRSALERIRETVWPRAGWRRTTTYVAHRVGRLPGTPYSIAAGLAYGSAISFTPFIGFHILLSALLSWVARANILAAAIGTLVGNPWTFPFIWVWIYTSGTWLLGGETGHSAATGAEFVAALEGMREALLNLDPQKAGEQASLVFWPMVIGGLPTAVVAWFVTYWPAKRLIAGYQEVRRRRGRRLVGRERMSREKGEEQE